MGSLCMAPTGHRHWEAQREAVVSAIGLSPSTGATLARLGSDDGAQFSQATVADLAFIRELRTDRFLVGPGGAQVRW